MSVKKRTIFLESVIELNTICWTILSEASSFNNKKKKLIKHTLTCSLNIKTLQNESLALWHESQFEWSHTTVLSEQTQVSVVDKQKSF